MSKYRTSYLMLSVALLLLLGASLAPAQDPIQPTAAIPEGIPVAPSEAIPEQMGAVGSTDNRLMANDVVQIKVFQEDDLDSLLRISKDGTITFPLIGSVTLGGKTPEEAALTIKAMLAKDYLVNPQVNVTVVEYAKRLFTVLGQVQRPGSFELPNSNPLTLIQAIGMAGGYTRIADPAKITLKRTMDGKETLLHLNARKMAGGNTESGFPIYSGDIITVGESVF
jgi:polysaccharide export outer membrane protein